MIFENLLFLRKINIFLKKTNKNYLQMFFLLFLSLFHLSQSDQVFINNDPNNNTNLRNGSLSAPFLSLKEANDHITASFPDKIDIFLMVSPFQTPNFFINSSDFFDNSSNFFNFSNNSNIANISLTPFFLKSCDLYKNCSSSAKIVINQKNFKFSVNLAISFTFLQIFINETNFQDGLFDFIGKVPERHIKFENCGIFSVFSKTINYFLYGFNLKELTLKNCNFTNLQVEASLFQILSYSAENTDIIIDNCFFDNVTFPYSDGLFFYFWGAENKNSIKSIISNIQITLTEKNSTFLWLGSNHSILIENFTYFFFENSDNDLKSFIFRESSNITLKNLKIDSKSKISMDFADFIFLSIFNSSFQAAVNLNFGGNSTIRLIQSFFASNIDFFLLKGQNYNKILLSNITCFLIDFNSNFSAENNNSSTSGLFNFGDYNYLILEDLVIEISTQKSYFHMSWFYMFNGVNNKGNSIVAYGTKIINRNKTFENYAFLNSSQKNNNFVTFYNGSSSCENCSENTENQCKRPSFLNFNGECTSCREKFENFTCKDCIYDENFDLICLSIGNLEEESGLSEATLIAIIIPSILGFLVIFMIILRFWCCKRKEDAKSVNLIKGTNSEDDLRQRVDVSV